MALLIYPHTQKKAARWAEALHRVDPALDIRIYPDTGDREEITFGLTWPYPEGFWNDFPRLKAISSIGAGVSHILEDPTLDRQLPILKLTDSRLNQSMWEYLLAAVSYHALQLPQYQLQQSASLWQELPPRGFDTTVVGVMGLGHIGKYVAERLAALGFVVKGFANSPKEIRGVEVSALHAASDALMQSVDIWISILPLTTETEGIFNRGFFSRCKKGAAFINVGRGAQVIERDLLKALESGQLSSVWLDVFAEEPLPETHPFWRDPKVRVTPHIASITDPYSVAAQITENYRRIEDGLPPHNVVNRETGY